MQLEINDFLRQLADWWEMLESHYEAKAEQREKNPSLFEDDDE